jgi:hypothetical protein
MPSIQENRAKWNQYDWPQGGEEWSSAWGGSQQVWGAILFPRIGRFLPSPSILEIAPGFGRWTRYLHQSTDSYIGVDVSTTAVEACRKAFPNLPFHLNDGKSLPMVKDRSISLCFSYDSLVHVDSDTMRAYVGELNRVLTDTGMAFLHHSNLGSYEKALKNKKTIGKFFPSWKVRKFLHLNPETGWRDPHMTADLMREYCDSQKLSCRQELITWLDSDSVMTDCFTLISRAPMNYKRQENRNFSKDAVQLARCSELYRP